LSIAQTLRLPEITSDGPKIATSHSSLPPTSKYRSLKLGSDNTANKFSFFNFLFSPTDHSSFQPTIKKKTSIIIFIQSSPSVSQEHEHKLLLALIKLYHPKEQVSKTFHTYSIKVNHQTFL
jgi:hypothetical protein